ncbi:hypothetical protein Rrhod_2866 [Rhodococcus rhodnii LMG 5362]|uniref:Uncharacterized protein n=1 Tax=Rhodococcus rhodnii LMG 5362 TaxID=1273125 RepID=R7WKH8_9NOCA|nr:hypothetical protein Rrhod_2866 [Rhodococcus rhodnii LMG 5362]
MDVQSCRGAGLHAGRADGPDAAADVVFHPNADAVAP